MPRALAASGASPTAYGLIALPTRRETLFGEHAVRFELPSSSTELQAKPSAVKKKRRHQTHFGKSTAAEETDAERGKFVFDCCGYGIGFHV
jgi:hypothetical protein